MCHWWMIQFILDLSLQISRLLRSLMLPSDSPALSLAFFAQHLALKILLLVHGGEHLLARHS